MGFRIFILILLAWVVITPANAQIKADSIPLLVSGPQPDIVAKPGNPENQLRPLVKTREQRWWWNQVKNHTLNTNDTSVIYPPFLDLCMKVYRWGDHFFNGYNEEYVVGTGKRWKARVLNDNWVDSYIMRLPDDLNIHMLSNLYANIGGYVQYMAVSVGYTYDLSSFMGSNPLDHKKWEFGFNCARFDASVYYQENTGGTYLRNFGKYKKGHFFKERFPGLQLYNFGVDFLYFINNKKYSHGAAYNFSRIQKKSQASPIVGISYSDIKIGIDFSQLPEHLLPYLTIEPSGYMFHYFSYSAVLGVGYNRVLNPHILLNVTILPSLGVAHCYEDSLGGEKHLFSFNIGTRASFIYNLRNFFCGIIFKQNGHFYKRGTYSLFSSIENFSANIGIRF